MVSLAKRLRLDLPAAPWFTQRVRVAALAQDAALVVGALAKAARDIALMMQVEVGEAAEPSGPGRGGSSTMPHKRNPGRRRAGPVGRRPARRCWPPPSSPRCRRSTSARWAAGRPNGRPWRR